MSNAISGTPHSNRNESGIKRILHSGIILYVILIALALVYIMPFVIQIATSFKTDADATANPVSLVPEIWTTAAYKKLFLNSDFPVWFKNSFIVTIVVTSGACSSTRWPAMRSRASTSEAATSSSACCWR